MMRFGELSVREVEPILPFDVDDFIALWVPEFRAQCGLDMLPDELALPYDLHQALMEGWAKAERDFCDFGAGLRTIPAAMLDEVSDDDLAAMGLTDAEIVTLRDVSQSHAMDLIQILNSAGARVSADDVAAYRRTLAEARTGLPVTGNVLSARLLASLPSKAPGATESALAETLGYSRTKLRRLLAELVERGAVRRQRGLGRAGVAFGFWRA